MKQIRFHIFVYFSMLTICTSQTLLYECNFDMGLIDSCRFSATPGAPTLQTIEGETSISIPKQPLSDVTSILSPTTPNNEYCSFPDKNPPSTWPMYFCQRNSQTNYTCSTTSGTGNCVIGKYGWVQVTRTGLFDHTYTTVNSIQGHTDDFQCLRLYYYISDAAFSAKISVGWSAGAAPFYITEFQQNSENRWQNHSYTFRTPSQTSYYIWFQMLRDGGMPNFTYAIDEIKIYDGSCETSTTAIPTTVTSIELETTVEDTSIPTSDASTSKFEHMDTTVSQLPISTTTTSNSVTTVTDTYIDDSTTTTISIDSTFSFNATRVSLNPSLSVTSNEIFVSTIAANTEVDVISSIAITSDPVTTSSISMPDSTPTITNPITINPKPEPKISNLPLILGLTLGLGLPITIFTSGALIYYFKIFKPKQKIVVQDTNANEIRMTSRNNTINHMDAENTVVT